MKALTIKSLQAQLNAANKAHTTSHLQTLLVNAVYHGLVHGNIMATTLKTIRNSDMPSKFKTALAKHMPAKYNKKADKYEYNKAKGETVRADLGLVFETSTIDEVAIALDGVLAPAPRKVAKYNRADYLATVAKKLIKEGEQNVDELVGIMAACMADEATLKRAIKAIATPAKAKKAA